MESYNLYNNYGYQLKRYFALGFSKIIDIRNTYQVNYPNFMSDEEANVFDSNELRKDFETVGSDIRKALDSYGKEHVLR